MQQKTQRPVRFEITAPTRDAQPKRIEEGWVDGANRRCRA